MNWRIPFAGALASALLLVGVHASAQPETKIIGVGVMLGPLADGGITVMNVVPGSPAAASGKFRPGDRLIAIAQGDDQPVKIDGMQMADAVALIRGPENSIVRLTVIPKGKSESDAVEVRLTRSTIKLPLSSGNGRLPAPLRRKHWWETHDIPWNLVVLVVCVPIVAIFIVSRFALR